MDFTLCEDTRVFITDDESDDRVFLLSRDGQIATVEVCGLVEYLGSEDIDDDETMSDADVINHFLSEE